MKMKVKLAGNVMPDDAQGPYQLEPARCKKKLTPEEAITKFNEDEMHIGQEKFDGIRYLWQLRPSKAGHNFLTSRRVSVQTQRFVQKEDKIPWMRDADIKAAFHKTVIDGEIVGGNLSSDTQHEMVTGNVNYNAWDVLIYRGKDIRDLSLSSRVECLHEIVDSLPKNIRSRVHIAENYPNLYDLNVKMIEEGKEGFVVKHVGGRYGENWYKVPYDGFTEDCVVLDFVPSKEGQFKDAGVIGSVSVGQWMPSAVLSKLKEVKGRKIYGTMKRDGKEYVLIEVGTCSGFDFAFRKKLSAQAMQEKLKMRAVFEIKYKMRFENTGRFRHIRFSRVRADKNMIDCLYDTP